MDMNSISNVTSTIATTTKQYDKTPKASKETSTTFDEPSAVYEKSSTDRSAIISQLKAATEANMKQLAKIVEETMAKQGKAIGTADDMWKFLAGGNFTVDAETKAQAQKDIAEDGYWGVEQTSDRILDFAKALAGNDPQKADKMIEAFQKGFQQATQAWGKTLPDISQKTYDRVMEKFEQWKSEATA